MENKKLIKAIKKSALKQIKADLKKSVIKEFYKGESKKELKKLRKNILKELQKDLFGELDTENLDINLNIEAPSTPSTEISTIQRRPLTREEVEMKILAGIPVSKEDRKSVGIKEEGEKDAGILDFNKKLKSSVLPTLNSNPIKRSPQNMHTNFLMPNPTIITPDLNDVLGNDILKKIRETSVEKVSVEKSPVISEEKKEELSFFINKLRDGVSKLREDERNISYRKSGDGVYKFSFERKANFDLKFDLDLDLHTYNAKINEFKFKIDGFNFDKKSFEILDIVEVLDLVGFNISSYINEINGVNTIEVDKSEKSEIKSEPTSSERSLENIISDKRILKILTSNEIMSYEELEKFSDDFTAIKGIGSKTAEKIKNYIKK